MTNISTDSVVSEKSTSPLLSSLEDIAAACNRDPQAFERLMKTHYPRIKAMILKNIVGRAEEVEDVTSNVFITAWHRLPTLQNHSEFNVWLAGIARNMAANFRRKSPGPLSLSIKEIQQLENRPSWDRSLQFPDFFAQREEVREIRRVWKSVLMSLKPKLSEIIRLKLVERQSHLAIALKLDIDKETSKIRLYQAVSRMRTALVKSSRILAELKRDSPEQFEKLMNTCSLPLYKSGSVTRTSPPTCPKSPG